MIRTQRHLVTTHKQLVSLDTMQTKEHTHVKYVRQDKLTWTVIHRLRVWTVIPEHSQIMEKQRAQNVLLELQMMTQIRLHLVFFA